MRIPEKLKIGAHKVTVVFNKTQFDTEHSGLADRTTNTLVIDDELAQSHKELTFIHEVFHFMNSEIDHALLDSLAEQWYQFLHDNNLLR